MELVIVYLLANVLVGAAACFFGRRLFFLMLGALVFLGTFELALSSSDASAASLVVAAALGVVAALLSKFAYRAAAFLMGRTAKVVCRVVAIAALAFVALAAVPVFLPDSGQAFLGPTVIVVYVTMAAPILVMMFGFAYALGCAGADKSRRGPFAKYLPDDHFE